MLITVADVTEFSDHYRVNWVVEREQEFVDKGNKYLKISVSAAELATKALNDGHYVKAIKPIMNREISIINLAVDELDDFEKRRSAEIARARGQMTGLAANLRAFDFFEFTMCNNELASRGYFITQNNREEKYIEIINSGDMELIECLETYLNLLDRISIPQYQYKKLLKLEDDLLSARTEEEIDGIVSKFYNS